MTKSEANKTLSAQVKESANKLKPFSSLFIGIKNYKQLTLLPTEIINLLIEYEECLVNQNEMFNEHIEYLTSGHHRDKLDVFKGVVDNSGITGNYIYFNKDGTFNFDLNEHIRLN